MTKIRKILFPTDFSDTAQNAFRHCLVFADEMESSIVLLHAIFPEYEALDLPIMAAKATREKVEAARIMLDSFIASNVAELQKSRPFDNPPSVEKEVEIGSPGGVIINIARREEADLIIMGTRGEHSALEKAFGSVTTGVIERAHCPVMVIPEKAPINTIDIIAYASDLSEADPYHVWKAAHILDCFNPILHVVHIRGSRHSDEEMDFSEMEDFFREQAPALQVLFHNIRGMTVENALEEFIDTFDVDVLCMYAPHHNLLERIFYDSRTRRMAMKTHIPLLLIKTQ